MSTTSQQIAALTARMTAAESAIAALKARATADESAVVALIARVTALENAQRVNPFTRDYSTDFGAKG